MTSCPRCRRSFEDGIRFCPVDGALVTPTVSDPNIGRVLMGQFELREVAGRGAMGTVYRAYQRTMDRIVAVKILRAEILKEAGVLRRFLREARAAAKLQHPNIVTVHMVGETDDGVPYMVMEHIDGVSLEAICEAQGPQPLPRVTWFGKQIASALSEAHNVGIIHRDLKPANILVTDRSRTPDLVKVLDFGIAKLVHADADQSIVTADGTIFGTPHYIAPEQASGGDIDFRADLYSLGVILFRLTTGVLPFEGTQSMQVVLKHLREEPPRPRSIDPSIPPALEELILSCLAKNRARRPEDADAVSAELDRIDGAVGQGARTIKGMPLKRIDPAKTAVPVAAAPVEPPAPPVQAATSHVGHVVPPVHSPQKTPVWATTTPSGGNRVAVRTPPGGTRTTSTPPQGARATAGHTPSQGARSAVHTPPNGARVHTPPHGGRAHNQTPRSVTAQISAQRGNRMVWVGVFLAAAVGASVGVLAALTHNAVDDTTERAGLQRGTRRVAAAPALTPAAVAPAPAVAPAATAADGVAPPIAPEPPLERSVAKSETPHIVDAHGRAAGTPSKPVVALRRRGHHEGDDDLPVTVVPSDEPKVVAHPLPVTHAQPPATPPVAPPTQPAGQPAQPQPPPPVASEPAPAPRPAAPAPPPVAQPHDDEPPPAPPPQADDPTTLPAPPPTN